MRVIISEPQEPPKKIRRTIDLEMSENEWDLLRKQASELLVQDTPHYVPRGSIMSTFLNNLYNAG